MQSEVKVNTQLLGLKDLKLHIEDTGGTGRPVILIHGWPLSGAAWKNQVSDLMQAGFRVITYDRRGFGDSDKPIAGYDYKTLAKDLAGLIDALNLTDVTLVGFSMGGGEVVQYIADHGETRLRSIVLASAIPPMMMKLPNNPDGPLEPAKAAKMASDLTANSDAFYDQFTKDFFSANADGRILVSEAQRDEALALCEQASKAAALECMQSFGATDFRDDLKTITVPTLIIHGTADGVVPYEGSGARAHQAIPQSTVHLIEGGPHGVNVSHVAEFNSALVAFLQKETGPGFGKNVLDRPVPVTE